MLGNFAAYLLEMSKNLPTGPATGPEDVRVTFAVHLWQGNLGLTLAQVMLASQFDLSDATNPACQMWVRRRCPCKKDMKNPVLSVAVRSPVSAYSTLTVSPSEHSTVPAPKTKGKRKNATAVQSERVAKKAAEEHYKKAHKRATLLYEEESKKKGGLSASAVREAVLKST